MLNKLAIFFVFTFFSLLACKANVIPQKKDIQSNNTVAIDTIVPEKKSISEVKINMQDPIADLMKQSDDLSAQIKGILSNPERTKLANEKRVINRKLKAETNDANKLALETERNNINKSIEDLDMSLGIKDLRTKRTATNKKIRSLLLDKRAELRDQINALQAGPERAKLLKKRKQVDEDMKAYTK